MDKTFKFALPSPNFNKNIKDDFKPKPHYLTPSGMSLLPREKQPPPMYGKHGPTLPARYLKQHAVQIQQEVINTPEKHYCEPCEMELYSLDDLRRHRSQHEKCPVTGCVYRGHPSVMDKHINSLHSSGLFDKFKKLSTPEELAAWREERRKRYPTLANVLLKQKAKEQRQKRGERLEDSKNRFGKGNDRKRAQSNVRENKDFVHDKKPREENKKNSKTNKKRKNKNKLKNPEIKPKVQTAENHENEVLEDGHGLNCCGIKMFRGTSQLENYKHFHEKKVEAANALFGLVGMYGSDDDQPEDNDSYSEDEAQTVNIETTNINKNNDSHSIKLLENNCQNQDSEKEQVQRKFKTINNQFNKVCDMVEEKQETCNEKECLESLNDTAEDGQEASTLIVNPIEETPMAIVNEPCKQNDKSSDDEAPEEAPIQRSIPDFPVQPERQGPVPILVNVPKSKCAELKTQKMLITKQSKKFGLNYRNARLRKQNTLLEKLLETDVRHERNALLQCVRFVCENNFFNIGQNRNQKNTATNKL